MNWLDLLEPIAKRKDKRSPMYLRITECIRQSIESGVLGDEEKLPPNRELAKLLRVDRSTIARAYEQLESDGLIYSHVGRGTYVRRAAAPISERKPSQALDEIVWEHKFARTSQAVFSLVQRQPLINSSEKTISLAAGSPTEEFFPARDFQKIVETLLASPFAPEMFGYSQPQGHPALVEEVRAYLGRQGIEASEDELLIVSGSQQAIDLVARTLVDPDDVVLVEDPTYFWAIATFAVNGAKCVPVSTGSAGVKLDAFDNAAGRISAKLFYCMPSYQNPTGSTLSVDHRKRLLTIARQHQVPILEDNYVGDLFYTPQRPPSLRALDGTAGGVIYQGTFSKALCPGLRLGWLVASPHVMSRLRLVKRACDLSSNTMSQLILAEYLKRGLYEEHLETVRSAYGKRLDAMCSAIETHLSDWVTFERPQGGMFIFAKLPPGYSSRELLPFAQREGVNYSPGDVYYISDAGGEFMRLNFIQQTPELLAEGVKRLAKALTAYSSSRKKNDRARGSKAVAEATFI